MKIEIVQKGEHFHLRLHWPSGISVLNIYILKIEIQKETIRPASISLFPFCRRTSNYIKYWSFLKGFIHSLLCVIIFHTQLLLKYKIIWNLTVTANRLIIRYWLKISLYNWWPESSFVIHFFFQKGNNLSTKFSLNKNVQQ